jgi:uncharacterized phage protein gp47/JayE
MSDSYGVTPTGFVRKPFDKILADIEARQKALIGDDWDAPAGTPSGDLNRIYAEEIAQVWEVAEATYAARSRSGGAKGAALDDIGDLTGTLRAKARFSKVLVSLTLAEGTTVAASEDEPAIISVQGKPEARFLITADVVAPEGGGSVVGVLAVAENAGAVFAAAGKLTVIETPVFGWTGVNNPADAEVGAPIETDPQYRLRQEQELQAAGGGTINGIRGDLLRVVGVTAAQVIENTDSITVDGMPPHSVEAVVQGGEAGDIAASLAANVIGGIKAHGSEPAVMIADSQGIEHAYRFSRPTARRVYLAIELEVDGTFDEEAFKTKIALSTVTLADDGYLDVGTDVYAGRITCTAIEVPGVTNVISVGLSFSSISDPGDGAPKLSIGSREIGTINTTNIEVVA